MKTGIILDLLDLLKELLLGFLSIGGLVLGWLVKVQREENKEMDTRIRQTQDQVTDVKLNYVHKTDLKDFKQEFFERLEGFKADIKEYIRGK